MKIATEAGMAVNTNKQTYINFKYRFLFQLYFFQLKLFYFSVFLSLGNFNNLAWTSIYFTF